MKSESVKVSANFSCYNFIMFYFYFTMRRSTDSEVLYDLYGRFVKLNLMKKANYDKFSTFILS